MRRTVWDGDQELYEIQMPDTDLYREQDTIRVQLGYQSGYLDINPFFGRVAYTHGEVLDQPLSITRIGYVDGRHPTTVTAPLTIVPLWNTRRQPDYGYVVESSYLGCSQNEARACVWLHFPLAWQAYGAPAGPTMAWHGTLTHDKADKSGTFYRRNRQYDPQTGRFTQEDPIGLAGGLNAYGFANGDPVTYSDPYGLFAMGGDEDGDDEEDQQQPPRRIGSYQIGGLSRGTTFGPRWRLQNHEGRSSP